MPSRYKLSDEPAPKDRFAFLTCDPNPTVASIHMKAMPVILTTAGEILPIVLVFFLLQRYFVEGIALTGLKG